MARGGGSSGSMIFIFLICLCLSLSTGVGAYFYTKEDEDTDKDSSVEEEDFKAKYQEAVAALELERATKQNVVIAKSIVEEAQERLEAARRDFESGEYANDGEKEAARTRVLLLKKMRRRQFQTCMQPKLMQKERRSIVKRLRITRNLLSMWQSQRGIS